MRNIIISFSPGLMQGRITLICNAGGWFTALLQQLENNGVVKCCGRHKKSSALILFFFFPQVNLQQTSQTCHMNTERTGQVTFQNKHTCFCLAAL